MSEKPQFRCSFCNARADERGALIVSECNVAICEQCVAMCVKVISEQLAKHELATKPADEATKP